jgi:hypothetical protein
MGREKVSTFAAKLKKAFSEGVLNELGKATRYCHRVRQLSPYRMVMTLMALFADTRVESLADLQRGVQCTLWLCHGLQTILRPTGQAGVCRVHPVPPKSITSM